MSPGAFLDARGAAEYLGGKDNPVSTSLVKKLVRNGQLAAIYVGKCLRFDPEDLNEYLRNGRRPREGEQCESRSDAIAKDQHTASAYTMPDSRRQVGAGSCAQERLIEQRLRSKAQGSRSRNAKPALCLLSGSRSSQPPISPKSSASTKPGPSRRDE